MEEKQGIITEIIFHNEENGYTIAVMETEDEQFTAVGNLPSNAVGSTFRIRGTFKVHPKYGEQFAFSEAEAVLPSSADEIEGFLASGAVKGIGKKTARAIVQKFGDDTLRIMKDEPDRLLSISGIGKKSLKKIIASFKEEWSFAEISMFFQKYGIPQSRAFRLFKAYGADTIARITENPYRLADEVRGIGFRKANEIALKLKLPPDSDMRIESGVKYILSCYAGDGSTFAPQEQLCEETAGLLDLTRVQIKEVLIHMAVEGTVMPDHVQDQDVIYLYAYYEAEKKTAANIAHLVSAELKPLQTDILSSIDMTEVRTGIRLSDEQKKAVQSSLTRGVSVITGGPGTGKTTIIHALLDIFDGSGFKTLLAAPTGRAAKRITETSGREASTIHRMLDYTRGEDEHMAFGKNADDPLKCDAVIVDEASMIDLLLMRALTDALQPGTRLILVGDSDQLPSVGAGDVLSDVMDSGLAGVSRLTTIFRQAEESRIVVNAHRINQGEYPIVNGRGSDFFFMRRNTEQQIQELIVELASKRLITYYTDLDPLKDIQVMTPVHKGTVGTQALNQVLQQTFNPPSPEKKEHKSRGLIFRTGDKVMQIKNDYQLAWKRIGDDHAGTGVFNGDVGYITAVHPQEQQLTVQYDEDKYASYDFSQLDELTLAYAITVHKSQGSEFPVIIMPLSWFPPMLATRNLLYTAVTRGKRGVVLVGTERALKGMVDNDRNKQRFSGLGWRLSQLTAYTEEPSAESDV